MEHSTSVSATPPNATDFIPPAEPDPQDKRRVIGYVTRCSPWSAKYVHALPLHSQINLIQQYVYSHDDQLYFDEENCLVVEHDKQAARPITGRNAFVTMLTRAHIGDHIVIPTPMTLRCQFSSLHPLLQAFGLTCAIASKPKYDTLFPEVGQRMQELIADRFVYKTAVIPDRRLESKLNMLYGQKPKLTRFERYLPTRILEY